MAMRRPRIKPVANIQLNAKRKAKTTNDVKPVKAGESDVNVVQVDGKQVDVLATKEQREEPQICQESGNTHNSLEVRAEETAFDTTANGNNLNDETEQNKNNGKKQSDPPERLENVNNDINNSKECSNSSTTEHKDDDTLKKSDHIQAGTEESIVNELENETATKEMHMQRGKEEVSEKENENVKNLGQKNIDTNIEKKETLNDSKAFKQPPKIGIQRAISHTSNSGVDDVFYSDIEENALQMDLEKSPNNSCPMSPSKNLTRQRIRPTPHFGQRRNSFVGSSPSPHTLGNEDNLSGSSNLNNEFVQPSPTRRERHHSSSLTGSSSSTSSHHHYHHHTPHKYLPSGITNSSLGRIRTESGCSVFSDTNTSSHKSRKTEDTKQSSRRDFEARFHNGVPEKSAIKMSDLIYYNPATNPMEQKPNPNVKLEQSENSASDVKPFTEKQEKDTDTSAEGEAVPVPQLKLNAKGELILDDKSLVIETTAEQEARKVLANSSLIYLDENTGMNGFYSRQKRTREWLPSETIKFYRCLQNVGTDFSLMVSLFPHRTRRDLKLKFKKEERKNCNLINKALLYPKQFDLESLKEQIEEEEKQREEQAKKTKITKEKKEKKRKIASSTSNRILLNEDVYQNENVEKPKRMRKSNNNDKIEEIPQNDQITSEANSDQITNTQELEKNDDVNHNEVEPKPKQKRTYTKSKNVTKKPKEDEGNNNGADIQAAENDKGDKIKRRRRRTPNKLQKEEIIIIKEEIIKIENRQESNQGIAVSIEYSDNKFENKQETVVAPAQYQETKQLQNEMDELLDSDAVDQPYNDETAKTQYEETTNHVFPVTQHATPYNDQVNNTNQYPESYVTQYQEEYDENDGDINKYEHMTFVNMDDGSVNVYSKIKDDTTFLTSPPLPPTITDLPSSPTRSQTPPSPLPSPPSPINIEDNSLISFETTTINPTIPEPELANNDTCSSVISERELNEADIQSILTELADGSLVLVSSLDPEDPDKVLNEIYMVDKNTGELCDEPLNIPDNIVQCILTVVS